MKILKRKVLITVFSTLLAAVLLAGCGKIQSPSATKSETNISVTADAGSNGEAIAASGLAHDDPSTEQIGGGEEYKESFVKAEAKEESKEESKTENKTENKEDVSKEPEKAEESKESTAQPGTETKPSKEPVKETDKGGTATKPTESKPAESKPVHTHDYKETGRIEISHRCDYNDKTEKVTYQCACGDIMEKEETVPGDCVYGDIIVPGGIYTPGVPCSAPHAVKTFGCLTHNRGMGIGETIPNPFPHHDNDRDGRCDDCDYCTDYELWLSTQGGGSSGGNEADNELEFIEDPVDTGNQSPVTPPAPVEPPVQEQPPVVEPPAQEQPSVEAPGTVTAPEDEFEFLD